MICSGRHACPGSGRACFDRVSMGSTASGGADRWWGNAARLTHPCSCVSSPLIWLHIFRALQVPPPPQPRPCSMAELSFKGVLWAIAMCCQSIYLDKQKVLSSASFFSTAIAIHGVCLFAYLINIWGLLFGRGGLGVVTIFPQVSFFCCRKAIQYDTVLRCMTLALIIS